MTDARFRSRAVLGWSWAWVATVLALYVHQFADILPAILALLGGP